MVHPVWLYHNALHKQRKIYEKKISFWSLWDHNLALGWQACMWASLQIVSKFRKKKKKKILRVPVEILMSQNKVLELSIIIINYCVIITVYYNFNCIINYRYNYIIFLIKVSL
jgi:hypothetical protein